ncbi:MAG: hypothetical protein HYY06_26855 [Deltaproteobacteria bacterium]|nr:hypothetical protein [Deltaproteobacteria bacterium]
MIRLAPIALLILLGCGGPSDSTPEGAFKQFAAAVVASTDDEEQLERVYSLLSPADRRELDRRARQVMASGGPRTTGAQMLAHGRVLVQWVPKKVKVKQRTPDRVELVVTGTSRQRATIFMVPEGDAWRVDLGLGAGGGSDASDRG